MNEFPSLYVSNLPKQNFLDLDFYKFFTSKGYKVKNAKVVIDTKTNKSRGYGYLQFVDQSEAERCLREMNNQTLMGLALRIVKSEAEGQNKFNKEANLLVKNIDKDVTQQEIFDKFQEFGTVISCKLETYPNSKESRGYAYVQYDKIEEAKNAIDALNEKDFKGKKLEVVAKIDKKDGKSTKPTTSESNNLFIKNLPSGTTDEKLKALFSEFGAIISASVQKTEIGELKDYGYVCFQTVDEAKRAIEAMNKKNLGADQFLIVNYFVSKKDTELAQGSRTLDPISQNLTKTFNSNVYIKHIPSEVTEEELRKKFTFAEDAKIISLKLNTSIKKINEYEVKSQYAYIMYDTVGNAQKAIQRFDQQYLFGGSKPITVEMWVTKEEKEQERKRREDRQTKQLISALFGQIGGGYQQ